jgi:LmbE family N-acetylglucosaminyl deacetylase
VGGKPEDEVRRAESTRACEILGARPHFFPFAHEDLEGPFADRPTLTAMVNWINQVHPDIVVTHWPLDTHPNHHSVAAAVMMAYKHSDRVWGKEGQIAAARSKGWNLYFYEVNNFTDWDDIETLGFRPELYLNVGSVVDAKRQASNCFVSQTAYKPWEVQEKMHLVRGKECGVRRAEAYVLLEAKPDCPRLPVEFSKRK